MAKSATTALSEKVSALTAEMDTSRRQLDDLSEINQKQLEMLTDLREEYRLTHQDLKSLLQQHDERLDKIEPAIDSMQQLKDRAWGMIVSGVILIMVAGAATSQALRWLLLKLGLELP